MKLTAKQKKFADEYLIDLNATAAYGRAGYTAKGNAAEASASRLLSNAKVQEYIQQRMKDREKRTEITQDRVLEELAKIGFANIRDYLSYRTEKAVNAFDGGQPVFGYQDVIELKPSDQVDGSVIAEVKHTKEGIAFKLHDKVAALEKIGRHLGMFKDKVELTGNAGGPIQVVFSPKMQPKTGETE